MSDATFDQHDQTVSQQTNVAGDAVGRDKITIIGNGNVVGDHNVVTIIQYLVQGVRRLPTDYATRIQSFLVEYLGTPEHPVPFGGRDAALAELDTWLADESPPYLLLTAPAGRGKSALLTRWSQALAQRENAPAVIFLPVSIRFRTNLSSVVFAALAARLAYLHGDDVPTTSESAEMWRGMVSDYLSRPLPEGRELLVILDGVDEAADWPPGPDLFPLVPPPGLRVVLSARHTVERPDAATWRRTLGWERLDLSHTLYLDPLDRPGVADVLARMGVPLDVLARDVDVITELYRLSEGDPLLVRLYMDDLWEQGEETTRLRPEDLLTIRPGLKGYFDHWWEDQHALWGEKTPLKEPAVQTTLNLLACALGPLTGDDLLTLSAECGPDCGLNTWTLEESLRPLARFILDNGKAQGYTFNHPRLGQYFYDKLAARDRAVWGGRFLTWGKQTLTALDSGVLTPRDAPAYVVQYYGAHLERSGAGVDDLAALVSEGWMHAWEAFQGTYDGFLSNVDHVWRTVERINAKAIAQDKQAPRLSLEVKCALCFSSIHSLADTFSTELIELLVQEGAWTTSQALAYIKKKTNDLMARLAFEVLVSHLSKNLLGEALYVALSIRSELTQARALAKLAPYLSDDLLAQVLHAIEEMKSEHDRAQSLAGIGKYFPEGMRVKALMLVDEIQRPEDRAAALTGFLKFMSDEQLRQTLKWTKTLKYNHTPPDPIVELIACLAERGYHLEALEEMQGVEFEDRRTWALVRAMRYFPERLFENVILLARTMRDVTNFSVVICNIIPLVRPDLRDELLREQLTTARSETRENVRAFTLGRVARYLPYELVEEALEIAWTIEFHGDRSAALIPLISRLAELGYAKKALKILASLEEPEKPSAMLEIIPHLSQQILLNKVMSDPQRLCLSVLIKLVPYLLQSQRGELIKEILRVSRIIGDSNFRNQTLVNLAPYLPKEILGEILVLVRTMDPKWERVELLSQLALCMTEAYRHKILTEALHTVRLIDFEPRKGSSLAKLAPYLSVELIEIAYEIALEIEDPIECAETLMNIWSFLPKMARTDSLESVLEISRMWTELDTSKQHILESLTIHLAESGRHQEALSIFSVIGWPSAAVFASLLCVLPYVYHSIILDRALEMILSTQYISTQAELLSNVAEYLPDNKKKEILQYVLEASRGTEDDFRGERAGALAQLAPHLSEAEQSRVLIEVITAIKSEEIEEDRCVDIVISILPYVPEHQRGDVLRMILIIACSIETHYGRCMCAIKKLVPYLTPIANDQFYIWWTDMLHTLSKRDRSNLFCDLATLAPVIHALGGEDAILETYHAIQDVCTWWP